MILDARQSIQLVKPEDITEDVWQNWSDLVRANPAFSSPYFRPEFTQTLARVRDDIRIALFKRNSEVCGILPLHVNSENIACPIGENLSDYHAVIASEDFSFSTREFLQACNLKAFYFDHLLSNNPELKQYSWGQDSSPYLDLSQGYDTYLKDRKKNSSLIKNTLRKERKLIREVGELRFVTHTQDPEILERLFELKSAQYKRTNRPDVISLPWVKQFLNEIWKQDSPDFSGLLSTLYAGDQLIAIHFGMLTGSELHMWFPTYEPEFHKYSPGLILLLHMAQASDLNLTRIDLGKGEEQYKDSFKSDEIELWEGAIDSRSVHRWWKQKVYETRKWTKTTKLGQRSLSVYKSMKSTFKA